MLQHGAISGKLDVLFGKIVSPPSLNQREKPLSFSCGQNDSGEIRGLGSNDHEVPPVINKDGSSHN
jgi:hypothetical protein